MNEFTQTYLNQQTSGKLEGFLFYCMNKKCWSSYDYLIPEILKILKERGYEVSEIVQDSWNRYVSSVSEISEM